LYIADRKWRFLAGAKGCLSEQGPRRAPFVFLFTPASIPGRGANQQQYDC